jgi:predicted CoA-binding protein
MDQKINRFVNSGAIAVVGVSSSKMKFGTWAYRSLKKNGYRVFGVNPSLGSCEGDTCYASLSELPEPVEAVLVSVKPEKVGNLISEATRHGVKRLWFQEGADYSKLADQASEAGLEVVTDRCLLLYAEPVTGIHRVHRFFAKLFGKL